MLAIPPNRQSAPNKTQNCGRTRLLTRTARIVAAFAVLAGSTQPCRSESASSEPQSQQRAGRVVVVDDNRERSLITGTKDGPAVVVGAPTFTPPLSVADYDNYNKRNAKSQKSSVQPAPSPAPVQTATKPPISEGHKQINEVTGVRFAKRPEPAPPAKLPLRIVLAPSAPLHVASRPAGDVPPKAQPITVEAPSQKSESGPALTAAQPAKRPVVISAPTHDAETRIAEARMRPSVDVRLHEKVAVQSAPVVQSTPAVQDISLPASDLQGMNRSSLLSELYSGSKSLHDQSSLRVARVSEVNADATCKAEQPAAAAVQAKESVKPLPMPSEPNVETVAAPAEPRTVASADGSLVPLTTSNYLPANPEEYCSGCGVKCPGGCNPGGPGWCRRTWNWLASTFNHRSAR